MRQIATPPTLPGRPHRPQVELVEPTTSMVAGAFVESFRLLALNARRALTAETRRVIVLMSAHPGDGRSLCAASLAQALAALMPPVLLIDGDPLGAGLPDVRQYPSLQLEAMPGAPANPVYDERVDPMRVFLPIRRMDQSALVEEVESAVAAGVAVGATVIIDTPASTISSLSFRLAATATGVIYIARRRPQDSAVHREIRGQLNRLGTRIFGVVFNEA